MSVGRSRPQVLLAQRRERRDHHERFVAVIGGFEHHALVHVARGAASNLGRQSEVQRAASEDVGDVIGAELELLTLGRDDLDGACRLEVAVDERDAVGGGLRVAVGVLDEFEQLRDVATILVRDVFRNEQVRGVDVHVRLS